MYRYKFCIILNSILSFLFYSGEGNKNEEKLSWLEHRYTTAEQNKGNMFEKTWLKSKRFRVLRHSCRSTFWILSKTQLPINPKIAFGFKLSNYLNRSELSIEVRLFFTSLIIRRGRESTHATRNSWKYSRTGTFVYSEFEFLHLADF